MLRVLRARLSASTMLLTFVTGVLTGVVLLRSLPAPVNSGKGGPALKQTKLSWSSAGAPEFRQKGVSCPQADKHIKSETTSNLKKARKGEEPPSTIHRTPYTIHLARTLHIYLNHTRAEERGTHFFDTGNPLPSYHALRRHTFRWRETAASSTVESLQTVFVSVGKSASVESACHSVLRARAAAAPRQYSLSTPART